MPPSSKADPPSKTKKGIVNEIHRPARRIFDRRHVTLKSFKDLWEADLIDVSNLKDENDSHTFILIVICCFSKYVFARPLLRKTKNATTEAMRSILESEERKFLKPPRLLHVDQGPEFWNRPFKQLAAEFGFSIFSTFSSMKATIVERVNRSIKNILYREFSARGSYNWLAILDDVINKYNNSYHCTIHMTPAFVKPSDEEYLRKIHAMNHAKKERGLVKFKVGDTVRISKYKGVFAKGYLPNWSTELFTVSEVSKTAPVTYKLIDLKGEPILGGFYNEEIQRTSYPKDYLVEKVLKKAKKKHYVKFLGFPDSENKWIKVSNYK